jgi:hypothetical protein
MAGYSGTPLGKKLGLQPGARVYLTGMPSEVRRELQPTLEHCTSTRGGSLDYAHLFVERLEGLSPAVVALSMRLAPRGMLWLSWPKKSSGVATDVDGNEIRRIGLAAGLVDVKVCAVNDIWSGLKFVIPVKMRPALRERPRPSS